MNKQEIHDFAGTEKNNLVPLLKRLCVCPSMYAVSYPSFLPNINCCSDLENFVTSKR